MAGIGDAGVTFSCCITAVTLLLLFTLPTDAAEQRGDPAARLLSGESASERWELTARFDSGHFLFAEFLITNLGFGDRNAAVVGHIVAPDGTSHKFRNGRREDGWELSPDRLRIQVGSSLLDQHPPRQRLGVDKRSINIDLGFRPDGPALWSEEFTPSGYALDLLATAAPIEGSLWAREMKTTGTTSGAVAVIHSWINKSESSAVLRRIEFFSLQTDFSLYLIDLTTPGGSRSRWLVVKQPGQTPYQSQEFDLVLEGEVAESQNKEYPSPATMLLKSPKLKGRIQLDHVLLRYDPLSDLPLTFRFLVRFTMRPHRLWATSPFEFTFHSDPQSPPRRMQGTGVTTVTFSNPLPQPLLVAR
jgi:hypothetical protein